MTEEEKDKLIALSDLNRKDNIKYISSEAQGIAITLDSDRYAPTFCKLERAYICGRRKSEEQITELEEKISVLLSCKNCPENKGGFICQKEYEDKCLAQKIQYIKELQEEIAELGKKVENLQKYLDTRNCYRECAETWLKLTEAKKLLKQFLEAKNGEDTYKAEWEAEQFLKDCEVE